MIGHDDRVGKQREGEERLRVRKGKRVRKEVGYSYPLASSCILFSLIHGFWRRLSGKILPYGHLGKKNPEKARTMKIRHVFFNKLVLQE